MAFASFSPLRHRSFALALTSNFLSSTGGWMQSVALGVYITEMTHNAVWLGILTMAAWLPALIGSPLGGVVADRYPRQRWIQINNALMAGEATTLAIAALSHHLSPTFACALALVEGLCGSASWAAWQSLLPDLVDAEEVLAAVSLSSAQFNLGRIIGPVLAAVALAAGSPGWCFAINAASFIIVVVTFTFVRTPARQRVTTKVHVVTETVEGAKVMWGVPGCRNPIVSIALIGLVVSPFISLVPAMAIDVLHAGRVGTSWLVTAQGVGAVVSAVTMPYVAKRTSREHVMVAGLAVMAVALAAYAEAPTLATSVVALFFLGGAYVASLTGLNTSVQLSAPTTSRSRILALYTLSLSVFYPLGALAEAALTRLWGVRNVSLGAAIILAAWWGALKLFRPGFFHQMGMSPVLTTAGLAD